MTNSMSPFKVSKPSVKVPDFGGGVGFVMTQCYPKQDSKKNIFDSQFHQHNPASL